MPLGPLADGFQRRVQVGNIVADHPAGNDRLLPFVLQIHLRHRDIELAVQAVDERLEPSALFFERGAAGEVEMDGESAEHCELFVRVERVKKFPGSHYFDSSKSFQAQEVLIATDNHLSLSSLRNG